MITGCELTLWNCRVRGGTFPQENLSCGSKEKTSHPGRSYRCLMHRESDGHWSSQALQNLAPQPALPSLQSMMKNTENTLQTLAPSWMGRLSMVPRGLNQVWASAVFTQSTLQTVCILFLQCMCASLLNRASVSVSLSCSLTAWDCDENFPLQLCYPLSQRHHTCRIPRHFLVRCKYHFCKQLQRALSTLAITRELPEHTQRASSVPWRRLLISGGYLSSNLSGGALATLSHILPQACFLLSEIQMLVDVHQRAAETIR